MKKFRVSVTRRLWVAGYVDVEADDELAALRDVGKQIETGWIQTTDAVWNDPEYEDHSFDTTGAVLEVTEEDA